MKHLIIVGAYGLVGSTMLDVSHKFFDEQMKVTKIKCDEFPGDMEMADYIIHAGGYGQPLRFTEDKIATIEINTILTINLFSYLKPGGKFLFVSTSEIYSGSKPPYKEDIMGTTTPQHPRSCYIEGKRCGESICMAYQEQGYDIKIARLALAYGPTKLGDTRVLNQFIEQGLNGEIKLRDSGFAIRTYCYVEDACELMWKILLWGRDVVYNVGGFSTITIAGLAEEIGHIMNARVIIPEIETPLVDAPENVRLDMTKTLKEFDQKFTSLDKGLKMTIKKYNGKFIKKIR